VTVQPSNDQDEDTRIAEEILGVRGLIERDDQGAWKTTRRWQNALARAQVRLMAAGDGGSDLRIPIIVALVDVFGDTHDADSLASCVHLMLDLERRDQRRLWRLRPPPPSPL
jgi:hypothetical protein